MGGDNKKDNLAILTAEEHFVAHQLLTKMYPSVLGLTIAAARMARSGTRRRAYAWLKKRNALAISKLHSGRKRSEATRERLSASMKGNTRGLGVKRGPQSEEHKAKLVLTRKGRILSKECRQKMSLAHIGKPKSAETKANMRAAWVLRRQKMAPA